MNAPILLTGQQAVTASAVALPAVAPSPAVPGECFAVILKNLKASSASLFYGKVGVTDATGQELAPGESHSFFVNDLALIYVIAAAPSTATAAWTVTTSPY